MARQEELSTASTAGYGLQWPWPIYTTEIVNLSNWSASVCIEERSLAGYLEISVFCSAALIIVVLNLVLPRWRERTLQGWTQLVVPVKFLDSTRYRVIYCMALSAWAGDVLKSVSDSTQFIRHKDKALLDAFYFFILSPTVIILKQTLAYFPVLACVDGPLPLLSHTLGCLHTLLLSSHSVYSESLQLRGCSPKGVMTTRDMVLSGFISAPVYVIYLIVGVWFLFQALESMGEWEQAMQFYETAKDYYSLVRLLCFNGQVERAMELAEESGSKAACYHLARRLSMDTEDHDPRKAIHFYTEAQCYTPALQLAKELELNNDLMRLALLSSHEDMIDAARYYERNPDTLDKAIMLYHKGGEISKALELCFQHREFEVLHQIADDLSEDSNPEMTKRVADYFIENSQFDKAVELLVKSKQVGAVLELCLTHHIKLTEEMVEGMTPPKQDNETPLESERRVQLLERLADCCAEQGTYHLATKKFTQAGNKTKAMKCLLKSGDTEKIVFFAGVSRQKEIYIMAANYLQSLDWRSNSEIIKNIINFYTKGRAYESLAGYYDACAQAEIDEFQNYGKAVGALNEALKCLSKAKSKNPAALEAKAAFLKERVDLIRRFAEARSMYESDPDECIKQCQSLLDEPNLDTAIRMGDVFGLIIEHYGQTGNYQQAYSLMEEMRQRLPTVNMTYYVDIRTIETIHSGLGIPLGRGVGGGDVRPAAGDESDDSVGEEVDDGF